MKASKSRTFTLAGFGAAVIAISMMLGVFAYTRLRTIEGTATRLTTDYLPSIYLIGELRDVILLRYTLLTDHLTTDDEVEKSVLDHEIDAAHGEVDDVMNKYEKLIDEPEDRQLFDALKSARNDYAKCFQQVLNLSREGHREEARNLITKRLIPLRNALLRAAAAEVVWNKADADTGARRIMVALNWTSIGIVFCLALSVGVVGIAHDIRQRLQIEQNLRQTEDRFRSMFEYASLGILVCGEGGRIVKANDAFCRMLGYSEEELLVKSWMDLTHPDDLDIALQNKKRLWSEPQGCVDREVRYIHRSGTEIWSRVRVSLIPNDDGRPQYSVVQVEDIRERRRKDEALRESEERFRIMADGCPTLMWVTNSEGDLQFINRAYREFCGKDLRGLDGDQRQLLFHHEDEPDYTDAFQQAVGEHKPFRAEARIRRADGEWRWVASYAEPRFSAGGGFLGHVGLSPDITERKLAEQALLKSEEKFRQLAENIREVFWMMNANGDEILYVSPAYEKIWGRSCESLYQNPMDWLNAIHLDDRGRAHEGFQKQLQGEDIASEYRIWTLDGREKWIRDRAFPIRDQDGRLIRVAGIAEDITLRHRAEEAASKSAAQYQRLVSNIPDVTWTCDRKGRTLYVSPNCAKVFGWTPEQVCEDHGASWIHRIDPHDKDRVSAAFNALFELGIPYDEEFRFQRSDGQWVWARSRASSTYQENGNAGHERVLCDGVISEITEQKRIDEELRSKKAFLEAMTDSVAEGILVISADGTKVLQNEKFKGMFRVPEHTLRDHNDKSLLEHAIGLMKNPEEAREKISYLYAHRDQISLDVIEMNDGTVIDRHSAPVIGACGQYYGRIWTFRDITEKKRVEDRLVQLALAVEQSPASVVVTDLNGSISYVNRKFTECTGYSSAEVIGQSPRVLKSGHTSSNEYRDLWETITQGGEWCGEFQNRKKNGELYWESATIRPIRDKNGTISSFLALKEDITQKKHIEGQLRQAQKLEAVGQLAAGIAHEINTPAQYVANNTTFLKESWACIDKLLGASRALRDEAGHGAVSGDSLAQFDRVLEQSDLDFLRNEIPSAIDQSIEGLERVTKIVKAMKDFSHPGSDEKVAIDINKAIETTIAVARNEWKYVADLTTEFETSLPLVPCLRGEFNQAILNLIVNAAHAIAGVRSEGAAQKGKIAISTRRHWESVEISVRDTGHGIPLEIRPRIFEPFFTTKEVGKGTGQGLSIAHNTIVKRLHGQIWFESEVGLGTTFFIRLPLESATKAVQDNGARQEVASYSSFSH